MVEKKLRSDGFVGVETNKPKDDYIIDIFSENIFDYIYKIYRASHGFYELDDYDMQVLSVAREQKSFEARINALIDSY